MAQLIVRNLDDEVIRRLKRRAAKSGRSMESEHRDILRRELLGARSKSSLKQMLVEMPNVGRDSDFVRMGGKPRKVRL